MSTATMFCVLLAVAAIASARPTNFWNTWTRVQQSPQCSVTQPASIVCQSALLDTKLPNGGRKYSYVHVCPGRAGGVCINTQLPRCCESRSELEQSNLECVHATSLTVSQTNVKVKIFRNPQGKQCYHVDDPSIRLCCRKEEPFLECVPKPQPTSRPSPPQCEVKRDVYFVLDATDSVGDDIFCRFGYVIQLVVAAINQRGPDGARVGTTLFPSTRNGKSIAPVDLFSVDDGCDTIVNTNIPRVIYEYYADGRNLISDELLHYPNVRAPNTQPLNALIYVTNYIKQRNRNASVIIITDGKSQQDPKGFAFQSVLGDLKKRSDVLIAAGIGTSNDISVDALADLSDDTSNVVYQPDIAKSLEFAKSLVEKMRDTAALCVSEANKILEALTDQTLSTSLQSRYCSTSCMWTTAANRDNTCTSQIPKCGRESLKMQAFDDVKPAKFMDWEKEMLEENILDAVEEVMQKEVYEHESSMYK